MLPKIVNKCFMVPRLLRGKKSLKHNMLPCLCLLANWQTNRNGCSCSTMYSLWLWSTWMQILSKIKLSQSKVPHRVTQDVCSRLQSKHISSSCWKITWLLVLKLIFHFYSSPGCSGEGASSSCVVLSCWPGLNYDSPFSAWTVTWTVGDDKRLPRAY